MRDKILGYFIDIYKEMQKVSWPKKSELKDYTYVVLITMVIFAVFVYIVDKGISEILNLIF